MPSTFRIPKAPTDGVLARLAAAYARRTFGQVPDNAYVLLHNRKVLRAVMSFEARVRRFDRLDPYLRTYAELAGACVVGCSWCVDFGYFMARTSGLDLDTISQVPRWRTSDAFSPLERTVMSYAEAMSATPPTVTDEMVATLVDALGAPAVVELTQVVALENMRSRFNAAAGLQSQGFSDACEVPLARPAHVPSQP